MARISLGSTKTECRNELARRLRLVMLSNRLNADHLNDETILEMFRNMEHERDGIAAAAGYFQGEI